MTKKILVPRGTADILPAEIVHWQKLESTSRDIFRLYGYQEIRTPIFEETGLFARSLGQTSDVVQKQMLNLSSLKEDSGSSNASSTPDEGLSLRPEATAAIVRSYIQNDFDRKESLSKFYYIGPMFRGERPQKGRLRQFHQIGLEAIGPNSSLPFLDAEVISLAVHLLNSFGIQGFQLKINSLGTPEDKKNFSLHLRDLLQRNLSRLCPDCQKRFERNVFRILDCKNETCRSVVGELNLKEPFLSDESRKYFEEVKTALTIAGVSFEVSPLLVRGLDYYTHTVFEVSHSGLGSQDALGAGGRYNGLVQELGGNDVAAIGFALGMERILLARQALERGPAPMDDSFTAGPSLDVFIISLDKEGEEKAFLSAFKLLQEIRSQGKSAQMSYAPASMKSQMRLADKLGARRVIIIGEDELKENSITFKDMLQGIQSKVALDRIGEVLKNDR